MKSALKRNYKNITRGRNMEFFDSHSHYNDEKFETDRCEILKQIYVSKITKIIIAGYNIKSSEVAIKLAETHDFIFAIAGISPNDITDEELGKSIEKIEKLVKNEKIVAIGEIGLDYYWKKENKEKQKEFFIEQIKLANMVNKPIVIHSRDAWKDTIDILKKEICCRKKGVFHCCQLNMELVKSALELGFYISFAGPITYKNSKNAEEIIKEVPIEKILIETDCPYLSPEPVRGTRNDSRNLKYIAQKIADVKEIPLEKIAKITYENAERIFEI